MMDAKEARDLLILKNAGAARNRKAIRANAMAILALERQIPKKPSGDYHSVPHYRCPECKCAVVMYENDSRHPFCKWCGQAIDWEDEE